MEYPEGLINRPRGFEQEIDIQLQDAEGKDTLPSTGLVRNTLYKGHPPDTASGIFNRNTGSRVYIDINKIFEVASPEALTAADLTMSAARQRDDLIERLEKAKKAGKIAGFYATNRVADKGDSSLGAHESFLTLRRCFGTDPEKTGITELAQALTSFLVARTVINGAGHWVPSRGRPYRVLPAQKMNKVKEQHSLSTTLNSAKPIFNTRDEPHADAAMFARLHNNVRRCPYAAMARLAVFRQHSLGYPLGRDRALQ